jgi:G3E family GTPase
LNVFLITGFLGSGKTTLLNGLLQQLSDQQNGLIENEIGDVSIDKSLISEIKRDDIFDFSSGCVCCSLNQELLFTLHDIFKGNKYQNLFIETTGIANPNEVKSTLEEGLLKPYIDISRTICLIDVEIIEERLKENVEVYKQIIAADIIVLNKINFVNSSYLKQMEKLITQTNPFAYCIATTDGIINKDILFKEKKAIKNLFFTQKSPNSTTKTMHNISTTFYECDDFFNLERLYLTLKVTMMFNHKQVYRIKGFIRTNQSHYYEIQTAGKHVFINRTYLPIKELSLGLIFIGVDIKEGSVENLLKGTKNKMEINEK